LTVEEWLCNFHFSTEMYHCWQSWVMTKYFTVDKIFLRLRERNR
jgi:hypothetical protein